LEEEAETNRCIISFPIERGTILIQATTATTRTAKEGTNRATQTKKCKNELKNNDMTLCDVPCALFNDFI